jgi:hypothetical protein
MVRLNETVTKMEHKASTYPIKENEKLLDFVKRVFPTNPTGLQTQVILVHFSAFSPRTRPDDNVPFGDFAREVENAVSAKAIKSPHYVVYSRAFPSSNSDDVGLQKNKDIRATIRRGSALPSSIEDSRLWLIPTGSTRFGSNLEKAVLGNVLKSIPCS